MKISVVTAVLNRRDTILGAIESVSSQDFQNIEHIIQDGLSNDGTLQLIQAAQAKNILLCSEKDTGIYDAINRGILRSTGDVIGLLHSDDIFASDTVVTRVASEFLNDEVDGVYGDLEFTAVNDHRRVVRRWTAGEFSISNLTRGWMPPHPTLFLRRSIFDKFGLYDTSYRISGDYEAFLRFAVRGGVRLRYVPNVLVRMRTGGASTSPTSFLRKTSEDLRAIRTHGLGGLNVLLLKKLTKLQQYIC